MCVCVYMCKTLTCVCVCGGGHMDMVVGGSGCSRELLAPQRDAGVATGVPHLKIDAAAAVSQGKALS